MIILWYPVKGTCNADVQINSVEHECSVLSHLKYNFLKLLKNEKHTAWFFYTFMSILGNARFILPCRAGVKTALSTQEHLSLCGTEVGGTAGERSKPPSRVEGAGSPSFPLGREVSAAVRGPLASSSSGSEAVA